MNEHINDRKKFLPPESRIPVSVRMSMPSKIPTLSKRSHGSVVEKAANRNINVIKPVITKRKSPEFKNFRFSSAGTRAVVKKSEALPPKGKTARFSKQMTIPDNYFDRKQKRPAKLSNCFPAPDKCKIAITEASPDKENSFSEAFDGDSDCNIAVKKPLKISEQMKIQQSLNIAFQASEFSLNQILNNKALPPSRLLSPSPMCSEKKRRALRLKNLEEALRLSTSKTGRKQSIFMENSSSVNKSVANSPAFQRRCTWASESSATRKRNSPDIYAATMAAIKRRSAAKKCLSFGTSVLEKKDAQNYCSNASPRRCTLATMPQKAAELTPYEYVMNCLKKRADRNSVANTNSSCSMSKENVNSSNLQTQDFAKHMDVEDIRKKIEALTYESPKLSLTPKLSKVISSIQPIKFSAQKTVYRPLKSLMMNSTCKENEKRLTDISEHSETDATRSLTSSFCDPTVTTELSTHTRNIVESFQSTMSHVATLTTRGKDTVTYSSPVLKKFPPGHIHTPRPIALYSKEQPVDPVFFLREDTNTTSVVSHAAPICTPLVLANIARKNQEDMAPLCLKLNFDEIDRPKKYPEHDLGMLFERRCSVSTDHILTKAKLEELMADNECAQIFANCDTPYHYCRKIINPTAKILSMGDSSHFLPIIED